MKKKKTGIEYKPSDKTQPYRVWYEGDIYKFVRYQGEAELELARLIRGK